MEAVKDVQKSTHELIGETMIMMQKLEALVKLCLLVVHGYQNLDSAVQKALALEKKTLGNLITAIKQKVVIPSENYEVLAKVLAKRNLFIHELFMQPFFDIHNVDGLKLVNDFCHDLLKQSRQAIITLFAFCINSEVRVHLNGEEAEYFDKIMSRIVETARPDFGGLTLEQYIDKMQDEVNLIKKI